MHPGHTQPAPTYSGVLLLSGSSAMPLGSAPCWPPVRKMPGKWRVAVNLLSGEVLKLRLSRRSTVRQVLEKLKVELGGKTEDMTLSTTEEPRILDPEEKLATLASNSGLRTLTFQLTRALPRCLGCSAPSRHKCSQCTFARYCSEACQKEHWQVHKLCCFSLC